MKRRLLAVPGSVLAVCLFLPALRVCGHAEVPASFPPCYAAYLGGIGVVVIALARLGVSRAAAIGAAIPVVLASLTAGGCLVACIAPVGTLASAIDIAIAAASLVVAAGTVRAFVHKPPSEVAMANIVIGQGIVSSFWAGALAFDRDGMWGSYVALVAALAIAVLALAWRSDAVRRAREARFEWPRAIARRQRVTATPS